MKSRNSEKKIKKAVSEDYKKAIAIWDDIVGSFSTPDDIIVKKAELKQLDGDKIYIVADNEINSRVLAGKTEEIKAAFENKLEAEFELEVISKEEYTRRYELIFGAAEEEDSFEEEDWAGLIPGIEIEP